MIIHIQKKVYDSCFKRDVAVWKGCFFSQNDKRWTLEQSLPKQNFIFYLFIFVIYNQGNCQ